jgi:transcriptional regulator with XRE-family HTH domain
VLQMGCCPNSPSPCGERLEASLAVFLDVCRRRAIPELDQWDHSTAYLRTQASKGPVLRGEALHYNQLLPDRAHRLTDGGVVLIVALYAALWYNVRKEAYMANEGQETLGDRIRLARVRKRLTLRELGGRTGTTASYLSDIENDRRVPSEAVIRTVGAVLDLDANELLGAAGRFGDDADRYLRRNPEAGILFRRMSSRNLSADVIRRILDEVPELAEDPPE